MDYKESDGTIENGRDGQIFYTRNGEISRLYIEKGVVRLMKLGEPPVIVETQATREATAKKEKEMTSQKYQQEREKEVEKADQDASKLPKKRPVVLSVQKKEENIPYEGRETSARKERQRRRKERKKEEARTLKKIERIAKDMAERILEKEGIKKCGYKVYKVLLPSKSR